MKSGSTCDFRDLPQWLMQDSNGYLHKGHRPPSDSIAWCLKSIFHIHTETGTYILVGNKTMCGEETLEIIDLAV